MESSVSLPPVSNGAIRIAVQKSGRLSESSLQLLKQMGLEFETYRDRLFTQCRNLPIDILFIRDDDIPEYVQDGVADLGIIGSNVLDERGFRVDRLCPLAFGYCSLIIAAQEHSAITSITDLKGKKVATSYPLTLGRFLREKNIDADVILLRGSVEIAPALQIADAVCDLASTGSTLRTNRLKVIETVSESQATFIGAPNLNATKKDLIEKLLLRLRGVEDARRFKYIMFNAPKSALGQLSKLVPGCKSPTILPLADPAYIAVHAVVLEEQFWDVVEQIRGCGGSSILVTPVEEFVR